MRIDHWMPVSTAVVRTRHSVTIAATPGQVYRALWETDFGGALTRTLLAIRLIPALIAKWRRRASKVESAPRRSTHLTLRQFLQSGFATLEEVPDAELVLGLTGQFWRPSGALRASDTSTFQAGPATGFAQATWNFTVTQGRAGDVELATETRVRVEGDAARSFRRYWFIVGPFSSLLRRSMLRAIRRNAERASRAAS